VIALKGQRTSHRLQPVQALASTSTANFVHRSVSNVSTCTGHTAMQRPQPVQRAALMAGTGARADRTRASRADGSGAGAAASSGGGMGRIYCIAGLASAYVGTAKDRGVPRWERPCSPRNSIMDAVSAPRDSLQSPGSDRLRGSMRPGRSASHQLTKNPLSSHLRYSTCPSKFPSLNAASGRTLRLLSHLLTMPGVQRRRFR